MFSLLRNKGNEVEFLGYDFKVNNKSVRVYKVQTYIVCTIQGIFFDQFVTFDETGYIDTRLCIIICTNIYE